MRIAFVAVLAALAGVLPAAGAPHAVGSYQYFVQPDPRACPSPRCGGYWVTLANRSLTRCSDRVLRARCYVATALDERREPLAGGIPAGSLVWGELVPWSHGGFGDLGALLAAEIRVPSGQKTAALVYRVRDLGIRCVRAPCFSLRALRVNTSFRVRISELDLHPALLTAADRKRAEKALSTASGLFVSGRVVRTEDGGRALVVSRVYLKAAAPRG
jgi:uncharacterized protein DUF6748